MTKTPSVEKTSRHFCNGIALQLKPSNGVMEAIRLLNKELPKALTAEREAGEADLKNRVLAAIEVIDSIITPTTECEKMSSKERMITFGGNAGTRRAIALIREALTPPTK